MVRFAQILFLLLVIPVAYSAEQIAPNPNPVSGVIVLTLDGENNTSKTTFDSTVANVSGYISDSPSLDPTYTNAGTINNQAYFQNGSSGGSLSAFSDTTNPEPIFSGTLNRQQGIMVNDGTVFNQGTFDNAYSGPNFSGTISDEGSSVTNIVGSFVNTESGRFVNEGTFNNGQSGGNFSGLTNQGTLDIQVGVFANAGTFENSGTLNTGYLGGNFSSFSNEGTADIAISTFSNTGTLENSGSIVINPSAHLSSVVNTGTLNLETGVLTNTGQLHIGDGGTSGTISNGGSFTNSGNLVFNRSDDLGFNQSANTGAGWLTNTGTVNFSGTQSITQMGSGTLTLSGTNTYTGATTVDAGILNVAGTLTSDITVNNGGSLTGSGLTTGSIGGAGAVDVGNSPGIFAADSVDSSAGTTYNFEFTQTAPDYGNTAASGNDVLRLTSTTAPFMNDLTSQNNVNVYFGVSSITVGDTFYGGFFTDYVGDFVTSIENATYSYYLANPSGDVTYAGNAYTLFAGTGIHFDVTTVAVTAAFATGAITGYVTQFTAAVPEISVTGSLAAIATFLSLMLLLWEQRRAAAWPT